MNKFVVSIGFSNTDRRNILVTADDADKARQQMFQWLSANSQHALIVGIQQIDGELVAGFMK